MKINNSIALALKNRVNKSLEKIVESESMEDVIICPYNDLKDDYESIDWSNDGVTCDQHQDTERYTFRKHTSKVKPRPKSSR